MSNFDLQSRLSGIAWPALPSPRGALQLSVLSQLERSERWPVQRLLEHQLSQLEQVLRHAYDTVPFYRQRLAAMDFRPADRLTLERWRTLPLLTRRDIQHAGAGLMSNAVPPQHGGVSHVQTSGSTGEPVKIGVTDVNQLMWEVMTLREHHWHERDISGKLASIRLFQKAGGEPPHGTVQKSWGPPLSQLYETGPMAILSLAADADTQVQWLKHHEPDYLTTYPTNLAALITRFSARNERPRRLRAVRTVGETVTPALRAACREAWGVAITDIYSSQELGYIALQCPASDQYHVMAEGGPVEILDADGEPSRPGEIGRLVVTSLHNFATPLIRYELRDFAKVGAPCPCGRTLPTLARIVGRSRNMLTLPTGEQMWPQVGFSQYRGIAPIRQYQLIQHTLEDIEVRFVTDRPLSGDEEARLTRVIHTSLGYPFRLAFVCQRDEIPRGTGGKFEEFVSKLGT